MVPKRPTYSTEFKAGCIALLDGAGYPGDVYALERVADRTGVSSRTLRRWWVRFGNAPPAYNKVDNELALSELVAEKKLEIKDLLGDIVMGIALEVKNRVEDDDLADATLPQLMTALGIGIDKSQLLAGKPTDRSEMTIDDVGFTDTDRANRIASLLERARARRAGRSDNEDGDMGAIPRPTDTSLLQ